MQALVLSVFFGSKTMSVSVIFMRCITRDAIVAKPRFTAELKIV